MSINITKSTNVDETIIYSFARIDEDGESWDLGHASWDSENEQFDGYFDTKRIAFGTEEELEAIISKRKPGDDISFDASDARERATVYFVSPGANPAARRVDFEVYDDDDVIEVLEVELPDGFHVGMMTDGSMAAFDADGWAWRASGTEYKDKDSLKTVFLTPWFDVERPIYMGCKIISHS